MSYTFCCIFTLSNLHCFLLRHGRNRSLPSPSGSAVSDALPGECRLAGCLAAVAGARPARLPDLPLPESFTEPLRLRAAAPLTTTETTEELNPPDPHWRGRYTELKCWTEKEKPAVVAFDLYFAVFMNFTQSYLVRFGFIYLAEL